MLAGCFPCIAASGGLHRMPLNRTTLDADVAPARDAASTPLWLRNQPLPINLETLTKDAVAVFERRLDALGCAVDTLAVTAFTTHQRDRHNMQP